MKKKIIGLSCGSKNGNCETYIKVAAKGVRVWSRDRNNSRG